MLNTNNFYNAENNLNLLEQDNSINVGLDQWTLKEPRPWARFFARTIDGVTNSLIILWFIVYILNSYAPQKIMYLNVILGNYPVMVGYTFEMLSAALLNAFLTGYTGMSIGKWALGIKIVNQNLQTIGLLNSLKREILIFFRGLGLCIPFINIITLIVSHNKLTSQGTTTWDKDLKIVVLYRKNSFTRAISVYFLLLFVISFLNSTLFLKFGIKLPLINTSFELNY